MHPCGVCRKGAGNNSILCIECIECLRWVHKRCSGISVKLKSNVISISEGARWEFMSVDIWD